MGIKLFLRYLIFSLVTFVTLSVVFSTPIKAVCNCNYSFCFPQNGCDEFNNNYFFGYEYQGTGCTGQSQCSLTYICGANTTCTRPVDCSSCPFGYGNSSQISSYGQCVASCGGSGGGNCDNPVCRTNCNEDEVGQGQGSCPAGQIACVPSSCSTPTTNDPIGYHDGSNCTSSTGWACDADSYSLPIWVQLYVDGDKTSGTLLGVTLANLANEPAVADKCGNTYNHRFLFVTPKSLKDGKSHTIYAYAISVDGGSNKYLTNTPGAINDPGPVCGINGLYGRSYYTGSNNNRLIGRGYSCNPYTQVIGGAEACGYWDNVWEGYLDIPSSGNYQFWITFSPKLIAKIDVNGNNVYDDACVAGYMGDNAIFITNPQAQEFAINDCSC